MNQCQEQDEHRIIWHNSNLIIIVNNYVVEPLPCRVISKYPVLYISIISIIMLLSRYCEIIVIQ